MSAILYVLPKRRRERELVPEFQPAASMAARFLIRAAERLARLCRRIFRSRALFMGRSMRSICTAVVLLLVICLSLSACQKESASPRPVEKAPPSSVEREPTPAAKGEPAPALETMRAPPIERELVVAITIAPPF